MANDNSSSIPPLSSPRTRHSALSTQNYARHELPCVKLRSASSGPHLFRRMIAEADPKAQPGVVVRVEDKSGRPYGYALYNPKSQITLRMICGPSENFEFGAYLAERIELAIQWRRDGLALDRTTDVYRLANEYGDGLPGIVIDRYAGDFVLEFFSLGMFRQADLVERLLMGHFPKARFLRRANDYTQTMEGFRLRTAPGAQARVVENGVKFDVELSGGYKTGFFCDQRVNRREFASLASGKKVLDLFSFTGGFGVTAKVSGAQEVTCVELDPDACAVAKRNSNINEAPVRVINADAFIYLKQMADNRQTFDATVLDPYKFIASDKNLREGHGKYFDANRLAMAVTARNGLLLTCSCSGLLSWDEFIRIIRAAGAAAGRRVQIFRKTGAGPDHPVAADQMESEYLKALWCRVM